MSKLALSLPSLALRHTIAHTHRVGKPAGTPVLVVREMRMLNRTGLAAICLLLCSRLVLAQCDTVVPFAGLSGPDGQVNAVVGNDQTGELFVGGRFSRVGDVSASVVARWDGVAWRGMGSQAWRGQTGRG